MVVSVCSSPKNSQIKSIHRNKKSTNMKTKNWQLFIILGLLGLTSGVYGQNYIMFRSILDDCGMNFTMPDGVKECKIIENDDMEYDYALKYPDKDFEVRYSIRPIRYKNYANEAMKNEIESQIPFRNSSYGIILQTVVLNISGGIEYDVQAFDKDAVKMEFNADWGATTFVKLNSEFGKGYKYCMIVTIHKNDFADAYYFYLSNSMEKFMEYADPFFHTLRFD